MSQQLRSEAILFPAEVQQGAREEQLSFLYGSKLISPSACNFEVSQFQNNKINMLIYNKQHLGSFSFLLRGISQVDKIDSVLPEVKLHLPKIPSAYSVMNSNPAFKTRHF